MSKIRKELLMPLMSLGKESFVIGFVDEEKSVGCFLNRIGQTKVDAGTDSPLTVC